MIVIYILIDILDYIGIGIYVKTDLEQKKKTKDKHYSFSQFSKPYPKMPG